MIVSDDYLGISLYIPWIYIYIYIGRGRAIDHVESTGVQWGVNKPAQPGVPITVKHVGASILSI